MSIVRSDVGSVQNTGSYFQWEINNFSTSCRKVGDYILSPIFLTSGFHKDVEWKLKLFSKGDTSVNNNYLSLFIVCVTKEKVTADIKFSILDNNSDRICAYKLEKQIFNGHKQKNVGWGFAKYVERGFVMNKINNILSMDTLKILCKITFEAKCVPLTLLDAKIIDGDMIDQTLGYRDDFESLFEYGDYSDVTFLVGGCEIKAHKAIITSRSPVFKIMFEHNMREKNENVIEISDINYNIMKELLRFMYANKVKNFRTLADKLLLAAEKYSIERLKDLCEKQLSRNIKFKNVFVKLELASMCNAKFLKSQTIEFILKHRHVVIDNPEFQNLVSRHRDLMSEVFPGRVW